MDLLHEIKTRLLHENLIVQRDDLFCQIIDLIPAKASVFVSLIERRRFDNAQHDNKAEKLFLPYLTFYKKPNATSFTTFGSPEAVSEFIDSGADGMRHCWSRPKSIVYSDAETARLRDLLQSIEETLHIFYYSCGHYDHFMANASRRFAREFIKSTTDVTVRGLINAISNQTNCQSAYYYVTPEGRDRHDIIDDSKILPHLEKCTGYLATLERAIDRKGTFTGQASVGGDYMIHVTSLDRSHLALGELRAPRHKRGYGADQKKHVLVMANLTGHISMDAQKFGPTLFYDHFETERASIREKSIFRIHQSTSEIESAFVQTPPATSDEMRSIVNAQLDSILHDAVSASAAQVLLLRLHNPFTGHLEVVASAQASEEVDLSNLSAPRSDDASAVEVRAFLSNRGVRVGFEPDDDNSIASAALAPMAPRGHAISGLLLPSRVGLINRGVFEAYGASRSGLEFDREYLSAISDAIGDVARRLELAADVAWLSRLSFLHSARHEIENFLPYLKETDDALFQSLDTILKKYSGLGSSPMTDDLFDIASLCELISDQNNGDHNANLHVKRSLETIASIENRAPAFDFLLSEVISELVGNAKKHSNIRASDFRLIFDVQAGEYIGVNVLYRNAEKRIGVGRARKVGTSPIPDGKTQTFHYGLFLLAAQVRMNGGAVHVNLEAHEELDTIPFEICFSIPLGASK